ncbi:CehA/McbA family metallohydrolase [Paenibacillus pabuli]|uniref:CehA/McbA family metallohydrolase n=1 Tax=Paenibacillus pabuli TaxID=1472 RepID=UPI0007829DC1|nr:CehA/McbA family metallohydrolase [Paenibacillus pabuli]MEC0126974.1 CehA/McbA family metallohydrolase [Paenibacillus pabuli]
MKWLACELHTHTLHSDGSQTLEELAAGAANLGFDAIALTDHNTMSALIGKEEIERIYGLRIIRGMEWTTFYGHMVTIGLSAFADWRQVDRDRIDEGIEAVHRLGGIAGLAHPYRIGSPACTGCFWEYEIGNWSAVDYIEVWSGTFPSIQTNNRRAFDLWTDKLNEGYRIAATSGRDWHAQGETDEPISVTYLGIEDDAVAENGDAAALSIHEETLIQALREGRASVTIGPLLTLKLNADDADYPIGSTVPSVVERPEAAAQPILVNLTLDFSVRAGLWSLPKQICRLKLCSNLGEEISLEVPSSSDGQMMQFEVQLTQSAPDIPRRWIRSELWGTVRGAYVRVAFTNAIYFEEGGYPR